MKNPTSISTKNVGLSPLEADRLEVLEERIRAGLQTFIDVGLALTEIRDQRLYRSEFDTFEAYCRARWQMGRRNAYQLIDAAGVVGNVRNCAHGDLDEDGLTSHRFPLPQNEAQARPLKGLPPHLQREAWMQVVETAPGGRLTAAHVAKVVQAFQGRPPLHVHFSSESDEWYTPTRVLDAVLSALGAIDLDPCSNSVDDPVVPATDHFTKREDGLNRQWFGRVFMNPPYGPEIGDWTSKLRAEYESGRVEAAVALLPARTDTRWFRALSSYARCFLHGRLSFSSHTNGAPFPSAAFYMGPEVDRFAAAFADLGDTFVRISADESGG